MRRVLVCGGRDYTNTDRLFDELDAQHQVAPIDAIISGNAPGADRLAEQWATENGIEVVRCPADWKKHGRAAGVIRNQLMLTQHRPTEVIAFPGGKGTADMITRAQRAMVPVTEIR